MGCHEYFRALNIIPKWPLDSYTLNKTHSSDGQPPQSVQHKAPFLVLWLFFFFSFIAWLDWFVICKRKELGHGAVDNPIYRFAIYYKFLWLLGPLSHRFVDCLLSWVLMSCCLNHCIIAALIHFLAYPHTRSVGLPLLQQKGLEYLSERTIRNIFLEIRGAIMCILPFEKWQHFSTLPNVFTACSESL